MRLGNMTSMLTMGTEGIICGRVSLAPPREVTPGWARSARRGRRWRHTIGEAEGKRTRCLPGISSRPAHSPLMTGTPHVMPPAQPAPFHARSWLTLKYRCVYLLIVTSRLNELPKGGDSRDRSVVSPMVGADRDRRERGRR